MSDYNSSALIAFREKLKINIAMKPHLMYMLEEQAGGFMTRAEAQSVRDAEDPMGRLIEILLGKGDKEFNTFCDMLDKSNHHGWAKSLRQNAEWYRTKNQTDYRKSVVHPAYDVEEADRDYLEKAIMTVQKDKKLDTLKLIKDLYRHTYFYVECILEANAQHFRHMVRVAELATEDEEDAKAVTTTHTVAELLNKLRIKTKWEDTKLLREIVHCLPKEARTLARSLLKRYDAYLEVYDNLVPALVSLQKQLAVPEGTKAQVVVEVKMAKCLAEFMNKDCKDIVNLLLHNSYKIPLSKIMATDAKSGCTVVVFLIDKAFMENVIHSSRKVSSLWAFQELSVTRVCVGDFELNVVQLLTQHFKKALRSGLTGSVDFVGATKALPYQVYALVDPDIVEKLVIRTTNHKIAQSCPEQEELVSGTADSEGEETTPEMYEHNFPPKVEEEAERPDEGKIKEATDSGELLSRVQELQDELMNSEWKRMDLTQENMALENHLKVCREQKEHTEQEMASLKMRLVSMLSSQGGADKDSALTARSDIRSKRIPHRWWLKVSAASYDTSLLPSSPIKQAEGSREMEGEVVFRRDTKSNLLKEVSGTEWVYRRGALERGRRANLRWHQFTRYHRRWLTDNVQKEEEDSCKLWLLQSSLDVGTVREREEYRADEGKMSEGRTGNGELLSRVQELEDDLKDSERKRMVLVQNNTALQKILKACREQEVRAKQEIASLWERLGGADKDSAPTAPSEGPLKRIHYRWWLKVSAGSYDTSLLPSAPTEQVEGSREMEGEVVFRRDPKFNLFKAVSGTEWMYRRGALERGRQSATANLHQHRFTRYHKSWLADNVQEKEEESCKQWLLQSSPDEGSVREGEEQGLMSKVYKQALRDYQEKIAGVLVAKNIISDLKPYLTKVEYLQVGSKLGNMAQVDELFRILLTKGNRHFKVFCHVLEDNGYQHWAQQLRSSTDGGETEDEKKKEAKARATADFKKSLEAALAKGSVEVEVLKCVTLGPTEAGKTQLKSALIGNFDRSSESTPMSTGAEAVMQRYVRGKSTWEPLTRERLCMSLHTTVKKKMFTESSSPSPTKTNSSTQRNEAQALGVEPKKIEPLKISMRGGTGVHEDSPSPTEANSSTQRNEAQALGVEPKKIEPLEIGMRGGTGVHEDATGALEHRADSKKGLQRRFASIRASVEEELKEAGTAEMKGLDKVRIIHMVDSGGQPAFFDIHPVIATSRAVYLLVYNMEEGLDHKPAITYRRKAFPTKQLRNTKQSNLDMIKDSLLTLHDCKRKFTALEKELHHWFGDAISESADELPVLVVGTRKRKESIPRESKKLAKECSYLPLWRKVLHSANTGTKLFAVDSMDPDCQGVQSVRQEVDRAGCIFKLPLPVSWFLCQLIFLSVDENLHVLTFSNLRDLCLQEGIISNPDEFLAMVRTFHLLGIFSFPYLDQELTLRDHWKPDDNPVFTNPDVLYQQVTKILEMAYRDLAKTPMEPKARKSLTALQSSGRLDSNTLAYLGIPDNLGFYSGFHAYLLEWLVHWGLAAKPTTEISEGAAVNGRASFFIPSVLPSCDEEPITCSESPLSFTFCLSLADGSNIHYVPRGIFPHLVVHIEGQGYEIQENTNYQSCLFRDVATFGIEPSRSNKMQYAYNVMVVDKMDRVTIAIDPALEDKLSTADCRRIVSDFKQAMETVYEGIYQDSLSVTEASECRCDKRLPSHLAMVIRCEDGYAMQCLLPGKIKRYPCPIELAALLCDQAPVPHPTPMMSEPHPMAKQPPTGSSHHQPSPFSALQFLKTYEDEFVEVVNAKQSLLKLKHKGVISPDVKTSIEGANEEDAKYLLFEHLEKNATVDTLREYCKVAIAAGGFTRMQELGSKMMNALPPEGK